MPLYVIFECSVQIKILFAIHFNGMIFFYNLYTQLLISTIIKPKLIDIVILIGLYNKEIYSYICT